MAARVAQLNGSGLRQLSQVHEVTLPHSQLHPSHVTFNVSFVSFGDGRSPPPRALSSRQVPAWHLTFPRATPTPQGRVGSGHCPPLRPQPAGNRGHTLPWMWRGRRGRGDFCRRCHQPNHHPPQLEKRRREIQDKRGHTLGKHRVKSTVNLCSDDIIATSSAGKYLP